MRISIVANFYMDPEVCCRGSSASHPSDSWVLADMAVNMAKAGCQYITVLGADFMSQNLHAILDHAGFGKVLFVSYSCLSCSTNYVWTLSLIIGL